MAPLLWGGFRRCSLWGGCVCALGAVLWGWCVGRPSGGAPSVRPARLGGRARGVVGGLVLLVLVLWSGLVCVLCWFCRAFPSFLSFAPSRFVCYPSFVAVGFRPCGLSGVVSGLVFFACGGVCLVLSFCLFLSFVGSVFLWSSVAWCCWAVFVAVWRGCCGVVVVGAAVCVVWVVACRVVRLWCCVVGASVSWGLPVVACCSSWCPAVVAVWPFLVSVVGAWGLLVVLVSVRLSGVVLVAWGLPCCVGASCGVWSSSWCVWWRAGCGGVMFWSSFWGCRRLRFLPRGRLLRVSVSCPVAWKDVEACPELFPMWRSVEAWRRSDKSQSEWRDYENHYWHEVLRHVSWEKFRRRYDGRVLVCWEKDVLRCHRGTIGRWIVWNGGEYGGEI